MLAKIFSFKYVRNISGVVIWLAIKYVRDTHNCSYFNLWEETIFSREIISKKQKNIEFFNGKFNGTGDAYFFFDLLPDEFYFL